MQEVFFHIGLHKTATTFLQKVVFPKLEGVNYINNKVIMDGLVKITQEDILIYKADEVKSSFEKHFNLGKNLISAEALSGNPFTQYSNRYDTLLKIKKSFPNAKIIVGIRNQRSMLKSIYQQYIRQGGTKRPDEFFRIKDYKSKSLEVYAGSTSYFNPKALLYSSYLQAIIDLFGMENVLIYLFEELKCDYTSFVRRFYNFYRVDGPLIENKYINKSLPDSLYAPLRFFNTFFKTPYFEKGFIKPPKYFISVLAKLSNKRIINTEKAYPIYELFKDIYIDDNESVKKFVGGDLHKLFCKYYY